MVKKILVMCFTAMILFNIQAARAFDYPQAFWSTNTEYEASVNNKNYGNIIKYGTQIINMISSYPESTEKNDILVPRYDMVANAYAELGDYENSAGYFDMLYNYTLPYKDKYRDYSKAAKARSDQYTTVFDIYTDNGMYTYYGAKHEKNNGVLFGLCANGETRSKLANESMVILYQELGQTLLSYNVNAMELADKSGIAVEFALNCPGEAYNIENIRNYDSYLYEISELISKHPGVPVFLRFAAEFDVWTNIADSAAFRDAFKYVSVYFKNRNSNVAIVWSPNQVSNWNVELDDYYPGDQYVDWVGVSSYAQPYFLGNKYESKENEITFKAGINSEPVIAIKDIVEKYGSRKPIMLSESGCGHRVVKTGEDTLDFALQRLREYYGWIPMVYPQVKLIAYFDHYVDTVSEVNDFRLSSNTILQNEYLKLTKGARFIQDGYSGNTDMCYRRVENGTYLDNIFPAACYIHKYGRTVKGVTYYIDGKYAGASSELPYQTYIDAGNISGTHTLIAEAVLDNGEVLSAESEVSFSGENENVRVEISGERISFDRDPIVYNDRTMVPMRKIFEALGAYVDWDENTQTVIGQKGDRTVKVTVNSRKMYVNKKEILLDTAPMIMSDRTLVPVRAIAEGLGCDVDWNESAKLVSITPKTFAWSDWTENMPSYIDDDMYYIERKTEYRSRTRYRDKEYFTLDWKSNAGNFVREETSYGSWGDWQREYIASDSNTDVATKDGYEPRRYHVAHYCTGYISDAENRYKSGPRMWHEDCLYHDLGWFDYILDEAPDGNGGYVQYNSDGTMKRCSNSCYRYYITEETGGPYTEYRSRKIYHKYVYWDWGEWSEWSFWSDWSVNEPYYDYYEPDEDTQVDERTVYRYKEK